MRRADRELLILLIGLSAWMAPHWASAQEVGGHFTLTTHDGRRLGDADLRLDKLQKAYDEASSGKKPNS